MLRERLPTLVGLVDSVTSIKPYDVILSLPPIGGIIWQLLVIFAPDLIPYRFWFPAYITFAITGALSLVTAIAVSLSKRFKPSLLCLQVNLLWVAWVLFLAIFGYAATELFKPFPGYSHH